MSQAAIEALLKQKIGLEAGAIGSNTISRAVNQRMVDCGLSNPTTYLARLQTSTQELEALIESIVVPETWFFRDRESFAFLRQYVKTQWQPTNPNSILRVLSVPCSTGEEPYSIAIALLEAGLSSKHFSIDAVDISQKSLCRAKRGIYSQNSFRGDTLSLRKSYFTQTGNSYELSEAIRCAVHFFHGNLLEPQFFFERAPYQIIFCRNVLIYLAQPARERTIQVLYQLLTENGLLFVGHSETQQVSLSRFIRVRHPLAFAFRKAVTPLPQSSTKDSSNTSSRLTSSPTPLANKRLRPLSSPLLGENEKGGEESPVPLFPGRECRLDLPHPNSIKVGGNQDVALEPKNPTTSQTSVTTGNQQPTIERAKTLADQGQLNEAAALCETYLSQNRTSAEAYLLLGQVRQAAGNQAQALECLQKAIYLKPNYYEALILLALLKEHQGDTKGAAILRQRIQRLKE
ncbi:chemotaxis protein [Microcoleus sp. FACHB-SPT15]|uniref:CheR family methyltransferase n=1 Tax=Microcoleus sp. FACHB-SPT15 TaxID=2692830 RepID=UPI00178100AD|nr:protein-glutamate O-methyltransferase CheR [Microcoleus sp. FACHB-SPT15]MBD1808094.1 chemotaxis protein [Microcoleus sp. FACHB-SPT15]